MKIRKILVTEKNIHALAGRIQKFFDSIKECGAYDYTTTHWTKRCGNTHYFNEGECCIIVEGREVGFFDDRLNYHLLAEETNYSIKLRIINPSGYDIKVGDYIHLDGNHFIHQLRPVTEYYTMYERRIVKPIESFAIKTLDKPGLGKFGVIESLSISNGSELIFNNSSSLKNYDGETINYL